MSKVTLTEGTFIDFLKDLWNIEVPKKTETQEEIVKRFKELSSYKKYQDS